MKIIAIAMTFATALAWGQAEKAKTPTENTAPKAQTKRPLKPFTPPPINWKQALMPSTRAVRYENYDYLSDGMSYADAIEVLGGPGQEMSSSSLGGVRTVIYTWKAKDGVGNMNATFQNDKLIGKAQFGLK